VIRKPVQHLFRSPVKRARLLAVLLLATLTWASTAEFSHHHGGRVRAGESLLSATESSGANQSTAGQIQADDENGPSSNSRKGAECLICQLHQNLSAPVIGHAPGVEPAETRGLNTPPTDVSELLAFTACGHGRAPPSIL